jgi:trk system potassium uptake protein TrkA
MGSSVLVVGLGRFGTAAALEAMALGHEVLAIDNDQATITRIAPQVTHAMELDAGDDAALRSIGAGDFEYAIVAMSSSIETSIFATMALRTLGVQHIVAKAASELHGAILERVGAERVVYAEQEAGARVAHVLAVPDVLDYLDVGPRFGIAKIRVPASLVGKTIAEADLRGGLGLTPVAIRRGNNVTVIPHREERLEAADELILLGLDDRLAQLGG